MSPSKAFHEFNKYIYQFQDIDKSKYDSTISFLKNNTNIPVHEDIPGGSYGRKTRVPNESDIDIVVLTSPKKPSKQAKDYYKDIWKKINNAANNVRKGVRAIKFDFKNTKMDFVPAYAKNRNTTPLYIANSNQNTWEATDPAKNKSILNSINNKNKSKVTPMIRFFKYWNYQEKCRFKSFHLEAIIMDIFVKNSKFKEKKWPDLFCSISNKLPPYINIKIPKPAKVGSELEVRSKDKDCLRKRVNKLIKSCQSAIKIEEQQQPEQAILEWKKIFGEKFGKKY